MAKLEQYRNILQKTLLEYAEMRTGISIHTALELQILFDAQRDHYQLILVGWAHGKRIYNPLFHFDIKNEKIWLQLNTTDDDLTEDLMAAGIPKEDIVLGFHSPDMRPFTQFAVG